MGLAGRGGQRRAGVCRLASYADAARERRDGLSPIPVVTSFPGFQSQPSFSPDGSQIAFQWDGPTQDNDDIYVTVVGSGTPLRLTKDAAADVYPRWSPDGRWSPFCACRETRTHST